MPPRNRISLEQRERIVHAFEDVHEDYLTIAETIGVKRSTARGIVSRYVREGRIAERPRGGANHVRVDDAMRDCLDNIISANCLLTIAEMNRELRIRLPYKQVINERTVARALEGMLYRMKLARPLLADRNRPDALQKRVEYGNWFMGHAVVNHMVFIDECGYNIWTSRSQRRALRGKRAYCQVCGQRGGNVTVALAISPTSGLVFHSAILGGMNGRRFDDFLAQTRLNLDPDEHVIFIYDGAPAHSNPAIPGPNSELTKFQPYSPFPNIVKQAVSALKAAIKADISCPEIQVQMNDCTEARHQGLALGNYRTQLLLQALQRNIGTITVAKCGQCFRFMQTYLPRCINNEAIEG
ncbi:uncharacterized protein [Acropora muricata]|uniref:uncharacterized protein n=1 Tax=Acropora muricata TaxID=159855 RepID=UPI0034E6196F